MPRSRGIISFGVAALLAILFESAPVNQIALAQSPASLATSVALNEVTVRALQEALNKQGIMVPVNGLLNDDTRTAVKKFQGLHHLPVTGEPDKATLDKLDVQVSAAPGAPEIVAQTTSPSPQTPAANAMNCSMMQGQMASMMQTMQGMMEMMKSMHGMMSGGMTGQTQPGAR